jgi:RNAse (barnase) inhibitor barstar
MAAFSTDPNEWQRLDFSLLQNSPVTLYFQSKVLSEDLAQLRNDGYRIDEFDCSKWNNETDFHTDIAAHLAFPDYYGKNLDAFNDCISEIEIPDVGGRVIVFHRFDLFAQRESRTSQVALDILASASWHSLLFGRRLLTLVQSDDPAIGFEPVGSHPVMWNPREWPKKNRGL